MPKYSIGADFGTLSCRVLLVDVETGNEIATASDNYRHAVIDETMVYSEKKLPPDYALQHPQDYLDSLETSMKKVLEESNINPGDIIGFAIDFTACTVLPVYKDGTPLCFTEKYKENPHAYIKLWKHHAAQKYATLINDTAEKMGETWLKRYGGKISSEWLFAESVAGFGRSSRNLRRGRLFYRGDRLGYLAIDGSSDAQFMHRGL